MIFDWIISGMNVNHFQETFQHIMHTSDKICFLYHIHWALFYGALIVLKEIQCTETKWGDKTLFFPAILRDYDSYVGNFRE